jgi:hypothetical protein
MIRFVLRFVGFLLLAAAFVAFLYDGTKTLAGSQVHLTPVEQTWTNLHQTSLEATQKRVKASAPEWLSEWTVTPVLKAPTSLVLGILGALLMLIGRKKKPLIGYAR